MSIEISSEIEERIKTSAQTEGVSVDCYLRQMLDEQDEICEFSERAAAIADCSVAEVREKIERGFLQSERGEVLDGEIFMAGLLSDLADPARRRSG